jgi:hypothetical protein
MLLLFIIVINRKRIFSQSLYYYIKILFQAACKALEEKKSSELCIFSVALRNFRRSVIVDGFKNVANIF